MSSASRNYEELAATLPDRVREYVVKKANICRPEAIHICDGSEEENRSIIELMLENGSIKRLPKYENCWLVRTDPADVARVESKTFISTPRKETTIPVVKEGVAGCLGNWMSPAVMDNELNQRFPGCMRGRTMYVLPFSMGPVGGPLSKVGVELTDSPYVVASMRIMTRMGAAVMPILESTGEDFVRAVHSVGVPLPTERKIVNSWPCNPERTLIAHIPARNEICSFGSGYGGNSLLGKKCFALRLGSILGSKEGWLAEHMLIMGITGPDQVKRYMAAAFPSACGKTNLAMMAPSLPGYKVECVGDDIAWMRPSPVDGKLHAINPEAGFFGVAPGTNNRTNPHAMTSLLRNTIFTNVAETSDGGVFWEGLEEEVDLERLSITDWQGRPWTKATASGPAAHPNSRFCTPAAQCPTIDPAWESPAGVPISAIIFGGRRPQGVPLVMQARSWKHGVFLGASLRSEATAAAEHKGKAVLHDPFAMRPFFGYNFGDYLHHWLKMASTNTPIFQVNWFRRCTQTGKFLWPGFGENCRVLEWIIGRVEGRVDAFDSPVGLLPLSGDLNTEGLGPVDEKQLFSLPGPFWTAEATQIRNFFEEQVGSSLPEEMTNELERLEKAVSTLDQ